MSYLYPGIASGADCPVVPEMGAPHYVDLDAASYPWGDQAAYLLLRNQPSEYIVMGLSTQTSAEWWRDREQMARVCFDLAPTAIYADGVYRSNPTPVGDVVVVLTERLKFCPVPGRHYWLELDSPPLPPEWEK
jgi:hypothetical protein